MYYLRTKNVIAQNLSIYKRYLKLICFSLVGADDKKLYTKALPGNNTSYCCKQEYFSCAAYWNGQDKYFSDAGCSEAEAVS